MSTNISFEDAAPIAPELATAIRQIQQALINAGAIPSGSDAPAPGSLVYYLLDWVVRLNRPAITNNTAIYAIDLQADACPWKIMPATQDISLRSLYVQAPDGSRIEVEPALVKISADAKFCTIVLSPPPQGDAIALLHRQADAKPLTVS